MGHCLGMSRTISAGNHHGVIMLAITNADVVLYYLQRLEEVVSHRPPNPRDALFASLALRFLLIDRELVKVASPMRKKVMILAPDNADLPFDMFLFYVCGCYSLGGSFRKPLCCVRTGDLGRHGHHELQRMSKEVSLHRFLSSVSMALVCRKVTREDLIRYVANKSGGVHWDDRLNEIQSLMAQSRDFLVGEGGAAVYYELLGTAALVVSSPAVQFIRNALKEMERSRPAPARRPSRAARGRAGGVALQAGAAAQR